MLFSSIQLINISRSNFCLFFMLSSGQLNIFCMKHDAQQIERQYMILFQLRITSGFIQCWCVARSLCARLKTSTKVSKQWIAYLGVIPLISKQDCLPLKTRSRMQPKESYHSYVAKLDRSRIIVSIYCQYLGVYTSCFIWSKDYRQIRSSHWR